MANHSEVYVNFLLIGYQLLDINFGYQLLCLVMNLYEWIKTNLLVELLFILLINSCIRTIKIENPSDIEILTIEINTQKNNIFVTGIYKLL